MTTPSRIVIGTAGHVDHGKTSLVRALTGVDTDRLPEEKRRGISIELGFARLLLADGRSAALIDVPGHERFVRAMVAGATGIDLLLLVVAADEGVMPQTREHLDICRLLGVSRGVVALTKIDLVDDELQRLAVDDVRSAVRGSFLDGAAVVPCSATTGAGLDRLRATIDRETRELPARPNDGPARLPVDRVFSVKGFGTVVTGTLATGHLEVGAVVEVLPRGGRGKIRSLEVHGEPRPTAGAGERVAANLQGIGNDEVARGDVVAVLGAAVASTFVNVEIEVLPVCPEPIETGARFLFHALTAQQTADVRVLGARSIAPGETGVAQIRLSRAAALLPGDRFVLRGFRPLPGYGTTIAGGRIVQVDSRRLRRSSSAEAEQVRRMAAAATAERIRLEIEAAGAAGIARARLHARLGAGARLVDGTLHKLLSQRLAFTVDHESGRVVGAAATSGLQDKTVQALQEFHASFALLPGVSSEQLRTSVAPGLDRQAFQVVLAELARRELISTDHQIVWRRGFSATEAEAGKSALTGRLAGLLGEQGLAPAAPAALAETVRAPVGEVQTALEILVRRGDVVRLKGDLFFHADAVARLRGALQAYLVAHGQITAQQFKELTGQSRKYAIPLAEHFDAEKVTLRVGEIRKLRG